jgi:hypothetical protein
VRGWVARGAAALILAAGIAVAVLLPVGALCPSHHLIAPSPVRCRFVANSRLAQRFAVAIASALPLAITLAGRSVRRWMIVMAAVTTSSGVALAIMLPSHDCPGMGGAFCQVVDHGWERFGIVVAAFGIGLVLVAASRLPGSRRVTAIMLLLGGITAALFLPTTLGSPLFVPQGYGANYLSADHRVAWRIAIAVSFALLSARAWIVASRQSTG